MLGIIEPSLLETLLGDIMLKETSKVLEFIKMASDYEAEMILDEFTLYLKELLLSGNGKLSPMIIERFFRVIAESKSLLALGSDGEFVLSLSLFKMMEALEIKDIDMMIRGLERELKGVEISEIMVTTPVPDVSVPSEVITITEDEIVATLPKQESSVQPPEGSMQKEQVQSPAVENVQQGRIDDKELPQSLPQENRETVETGSTETEPPLNAEHLTPNTNKFKELIAKIYDRNYDLGACFERNIEFESFMDNKLTWGSSAEGEDKKQLITHWGVINMFVKELFGFETKIVNIPKKKINPSNIVREKASISEVTTHQDADSGSMIEDIEMKNSCIAPEAGETEAAKEKDPSALLNEPMIKEAIALFDPKKVRIKKNT